MFKKLILSLIAMPFICCSAMEHEHMDSKPQVAPVSIHLKLLSKPEPNKELSLSLSILNEKNQAIKVGDLLEAHTKRIHVMILDPSLNDYQHIHPATEDTKADAVFNFSFTPKRSGHYVMYADITLSNGERYYLPVWFDVEGEASPAVTPEELAPGEIQPTVQVKDFTFDTQSTPAIVQMDEDIILTLLIKEHDTLFRKLEPTMGAFAHLVGFSENRETLIHAHPLGEEPRTAKQRGGPSLKFHINFPKPGWYRLFVQIRANDEDIIAPIDVLVN